LQHEALFSRSKLLSSFAQIEDLLVLDKMSVQLAETRKKALDIEQRVRRHGGCTLCERFFLEVLSTGGEARVSDFGGNQTKWRQPTEFYACSSIRCCRDS